MFKMSVIQTITSLITYGSWTLFLRVVFMLHLGVTSETCEPDTDCSISENIPCVVRSSSFCRNNIGEFSRSAGGLTWAAKARDFTVRIVEVPCLQEKESGLFFQWKPPLDGLRQLKGFKLSVAAEDGIFTGTTECRILDLRNASWTIHDVDNVFNYTLFPLHDNTQYSIQLTSLPTPEVIHQAKMSYHLPVYIPRKGPSVWTTDINWCLDGRNMNVTFDRAPEAYNFREYDVILLELMTYDSFLNSIKMGDTMNTNSHSTQRLQTMFPNVSQGEYEIMVRPVGGDCQNNCKTSKTMVIVKEPISADTSFWTANITWFLDANNNMTVVFDPAPDSYSFYEYRVGLLELNSSALYFKPVHADKKAHPENGSHETLKVVFHNVTQGEYELSIRPIGGDCKNECKTSRTKNSITVKSSKQFGTTQLSVSATPLKSVSSNDVIKTVLGCAVGGTVVLAVLFLLFYFARRRSGESRDTKACTFTCLRQSLMRHQQENQTSDTRHLLPLGRKTAFLLYSADHEAFLSLVSSFASYLQTYCFLDVLHIDWCFKDLRCVGLKSWISNSLNNADVIVVIHSLGASRQFSAWMNGAEFKTVKSSLKGCLFSNAISVLLASPSLRQRCVDITFQDDDLTDVLVFKFGGRTRIYKLMHEFKDCLLHVHKLKDEGKTFDLPLNADHTETEEGRQLLQSINNVSQYEKNNPDWFTEVFSEPEVIDDFDHCVSDVMMSNNSSGYCSQDQCQFIGPEDCPADGDGISISEKLRNINIACSL